MLLSYQQKTAYRCGGNWWHHCHRYSNDLDLVTQLHYLFFVRSSSINRHGSIQGFSTRFNFCYTKWAIENIQKNSPKPHARRKGSNTWQDESLHSEISHVIFVCLVHQCATELSAPRIKNCNVIIIQHENSGQALIFSSQQILLSARCSNESRSERP